MPPPPGRPKPGRIERKPARQTSATPPPSDVEIGSIRVGHAGITTVNPDEQHLLPKTVNIDDLSFIKELGHGAAGSVSLYKHRESGDKFAVKKINVQGKTQAMQAGAAEIRNVFATPSPNAVRLYNAFFRDSNLLLVMEYMDGGNLEELLEKQKKLPEPAAAYIACELLQALSQLHRKSRQVVETGKGAATGKERRQIHRDIKPANVMLSRTGAIKIADFGVAGSADSIGLASFVGTATYMSPERIKGERYGTASDIWSVGIVVAQILIGEYPFKSVGSGFMALLKEVTSRDSVVLSGVTPEAQDFCDKCLRQVADERSSADELLRHPWIIAHNGEVPESPLGVSISEQPSTTSFALQGPGCALLQEFLQKPTPAPSRQPSVATVPA